MGIVTSACKTAEVGKQTVYDLRHNDPDFAKQWDDALQTAADLLEEEARRRAHDGLMRFKFHEGQAIIDPRTGEPYVELEYSDTLLIFLLKGVRPEKYRERYDVNTQASVRVEVVEELHDAGGDPQNLPPPPGPTPLPPQ